MSSTIINFLAGIMVTATFGMTTGGPAVMVWGWAAVGLLVLSVGAAMAEITSAFPTSAALYYWSAKLAKRHGAAWSWYTGWLNFAGQIGGTAAADFAGVTFIQAYAALAWGYRPTAGGGLLIYAAILVLHGLLNTFTVRLVAVVTKAGVWWMLLGAAVLISTLTFVPSRHQSTPWVFTHFVNGTGFHSGLYAGLIGLLFASGTFTGFDSSSHMAEETEHAALAAPRGIVRSILFSWIAGLGLVVALAFAMTDYDGELHSATGLPPAQILIDALGVHAAEALLLVVIVSLLFCGLANLTSNSRQIFAFSRDGAMPGSRLWRTVSTRTRTPVNSVWLAAGAAFVLGIPSLWNPTALNAIVSISVVGLFTAYAIPLYLRLRQGDAFVPGPWHLGRWSLPVARLAISWVAVSSVLFVLPQQSPVTATSFNYAPVALGVVLLVATVWWFVTARRTFQGPVRYGSPAELAQWEEDIA
ncbi:MAG: amino acid permease [Catenulispora sp.]|nr:amino acid permease [Catenulispora sp.]